MSEAKVNASYHELAYKLYRESFSPHILMYLTFPIQVRMDERPAHH